MTHERRYGDEEVREIFERATTGEARRLPAPTEREGLTLAQLQDIGREVGLAPAEVARAAAALDARREVRPRRRAFGMPVAVGRVVDLPRAPTEREWEVLVSELRHTFEARGRVASHGNLREWSNGNLYACVEPGETGYRLRLGTYKGSATSMDAIGIVGVVTGLMSFASALSGGAEASILLPFLLVGTGVGALVANRLSLRRWAREREEQMEHLAARAKTLIE